jgi:hypothetical protein
MKNKFKHDNGTAGSTILLSVVVMLFIIGLIVMIFSLMAGSLQDSDSLYTSSGTQTVKGELLTPTTAGNSSAVAGYRDVSCTMVKAYNGTGGAVVNSGNYTFSTGCALSNLTVEFITVPWAINYTYTYQTDAGGVAVINDTSTALAGVTDWFDIFIVICAMVVLILLTVVIITAIRSSGMVAGGETSGLNQVGTA